MDRSWHDMLSLIHILARIFHGSQNYQKYL